jgi:hypothetical protein
VDGDRLRRLTILLLVVALAGCLDQHEGPLYPSVIQVIPEDNQNFTVVLRFVNTGDMNVTTKRSYLYGSISQDGQRLMGMTEYAYGRDEYARRHGEIPRMIFNDTDVIRPNNAAMAQAIVRFPEPLPSTAELRFSQYMEYDADGAPWSWDYSLPCFNVRGEIIPNVNGRSCENLHEKNR